MEGRSFSAFATIHEEKVLTSISMLNAGLVDLVDDDTSGICYIEQKGESKELLTHFIVAIEQIVDDALCSIPEFVHDFYEDIPDWVFNQCPEATVPMFAANPSTTPVIEGKTFKQQVKELRNKGYTYKEMAKELDVHLGKINTTIVQLLDRGEIERKTKEEAGRAGGINRGRSNNNDSSDKRFGRGGSMYTQEEINTIKFMHENGHTDKEIAQCLVKRTVQSIALKRSKLISRGKITEYVPPIQKEEPKGQSKLEQLLNGVEGGTNISAEQISTKHKEMLIEILHRII